MLGAPGNNIRKLVVEIQAVQKSPTKYPYESWETGGRFGRVDKRRRNFRKPKATRVQKSIIWGVELPECGACRGPPG